MKKTLPLLIALLFFCCMVHSQITTPIIKANFGVDADLRANYFNGAIVTGNDDWFRNNGSVGQFIIDTTGAAYLLSRYAADVASRRQPFFRNMSFPQFSVINNKLLIDAIFIRDYHGDDTTVFSGGNKNGMSPANWSCPVSQGIPDKNDILDMFMHVRRDGPDGTDSLWLFGAFSLDNTTGNRYIDFEMYQTDIYYDHTTQQFHGYGPDAGHTAWLFDGAGNVTRPGDIIFTAEYASSSLTMVEARIWVNQSSLSLTPAPFSWGGQFDGAGAGATYGYANITPKTTGTYYTGLQCGNNTWGGPFGIVLQDNSLETDYDARQFMEFSVNLSKLGLDPYVTSSDPCLMPFRRIMVKTRASTSFSAELKDFVGPFAFFRAPAASAAADIPMFCGSNGVSNISVSNPLSTSLYTWSTPNGSIMGSNVGPNITVNSAGTYIVTQQLMDSCGSSYASDTVVVTLDTTCFLLRTTLKEFKSSRNNQLLQLYWSVSNNETARFYEIERSTNGTKFIPVGKVWPNPGSSTNYGYTDNINGIAAEIFYYRLKITDINGNVQYSKIIAESIIDDKSKIRLLRNGVSQSPVQLSLTAVRNTMAKVSLLSASGALLKAYDVAVQKGTSVFGIDNLQSNSSGIYFIKVTMDDCVFSDKIVLTR